MRNKLIKKIFLLSVFVAPCFATDGKSLEGGDRGDLPTARVAASAAAPAPALGAEERNTLGSEGGGSGGGAAVSAGGEFDSEKVMAPGFDPYSASSSAEVTDMVTAWEREAGETRDTITTFYMTNPGGQVTSDDLVRVLALAGTFPNLREALLGWSTSLNDDALRTFFDRLPEGPSALAEFNWDVTAITDASAGAVANAMRTDRLVNLARLSISGGARVENRSGEATGDPLGSLTTAGVGAIIAQIMHTPKLTDLRFGDEGVVPRDAAAEASIRDAAMVARAHVPGPLPELTISLGPEGKKIIIPAKTA